MTTAMPCPRAAAWAAWTCRSLNASGDPESVTYGPYPDRMDGPWCKSRPFRKRRGTRPPISAQCSNPASAGFFFRSSCSRCESCAAVSRTGGFSRESHTLRPFPTSDGRILPAKQIFRAALTSRSWMAPHPGHIQLLTRNPLTPDGPVKAPQVEQARVVLYSSTIRTQRPACSPLYRNCVLSIPQPESRTAFPIRVRASFGMLTSPMKIV